MRYQCDICNVFYAGLRCFEIWVSELKMGSKKYQFIIKRYSRLLPASYMLYAVNPEDDKSADGYILDIAGKVEYKDNYRLFPTASGLGWYK